VLNQLKSQGAEGAHRAQRIMREVAEGRMTPEDAIKEAAKHLKISYF